MEYVLAVWLTCFVVDVAMVLVSERRSGPACFPSLTSSDREGPEPIEDELGQVLRQLADQGEARMDDELAAKGGPA